MKTYIIIAVVAAVCIAASLGALSRCSTHMLAWQDFAEKTASLRTFNDVVGFSPDRANPRRFVRSKPRPGRDVAYLRFRIPKADPEGWQLTMRLRAQPHVLKHLVVRTARDIFKNAFGVIEGDVVTFNIRLDPKDTFLWEDGTCYVGVCSDKGAWLFNTGDVIELLDFKFSLR